MAGSGKQFTGARAKVVINGEQVGWAQDINGTIAYQLVRTNVLGNAESEEIETVGVSVSFSMRITRILNEGLEAQGIAPPAAGGGQSATLIGFPYFDVYVLDDITGDVVLILEDCKMEGRGFGTDARGIYIENANFQAIRAIEADQE